MNLNLTDNQKQILVSALLAVIIAVGALFGYNVKVTPVPVSTPEVEFGAQGVSGPRFLNARLQGNTNADALTVTGALGANSGTFSTPLAAGQYVAPTAVNTPTAQPTYAYVAPTAQPTYAYVVPTLVPTATPQTGFLTYAKGECGAIVVTGSATIVPSVATTPVHAWSWLAQNATGDAYTTSITHTAGIVTISIWGNEATPVANTTPATGGYCIAGQ